MCSERVTPRSRFRSIGARLTLWGTFVTFGVCAALCAILYAGAFLSLRREIDAFIEGEVYEFLGSTNEYVGPIEELEADFRREVEARTFGDLAFRLYTPDGKPMLSTQAGDRLPGSWDPRSLTGREPQFQTVVLPGQSTTLRLCSFRTKLADGRECIAQASFVMDHMLASMSVFRRVCFVALGLSVLISLAAGRFLATRALRPLRRIAIETRSIDPSRLSDRVTPLRTGDELDQLVEIINELLERVDRYVSQLRQFTADASHEIRTPLTALRGLAEVTLGDERSANELRQALEESANLFERLQRLADALLLLTRLDAGEPMLRAELVDLGKIVRGAVELYQPLAEERGVALSVADAENCMATLDADRIRQVVCNLLDNAIKYTAGGGSVNVALDVGLHDAKLSVRDTGAGIAPELLSRVCDRFVRADTARSADGDTGAGLGLSICRSIVQAHGGSIRVDSKLGAGTTVQVSLPMRRPASEQEGGAGAGPPGKGADGHRVSPNPGDPRNVRDKRAASRQ